MAKPVTDPWLDDPDGFTRVDFSLRPEDAIDPDDAGVVQIPGMNPEIVVSEGGVIREPEPPVEPVEPQEPEGPEVIELEDGGTVTLEKTSKGWKATLDPGNGANPEVFFGKNKNDLVGNVLKAKLNATKKIRELNRQVKQRATVVPAQPVPQATSLRELTADENFEIKTEWESNPDKAFDKLFEKKTGRKLADLLSRSDEGWQAARELQAEAVNKDFITRNPDYYGDPDFSNFASLVKWIAKYKIGKIATDANATQVFNDLVASGNWTVENLEEAFEDLKADNKLVHAPKAPKPTPPVVVEEPVPAPRQTDSRIVSTTTRPRAALGIRIGDVTPAAGPEAPRAPSADELESLPDDQIASLLAGVRRQRALARRSS
jgi:hypothetical protein